MTIPPFISDNPFRLLAVGSSVTQRELRQRAAATELASKVGMAPQSALEEVFGSDDLGRCSSIVRSLTNDPETRTVYRLFWPFHVRPESDPDSPPRMHDCATIGAFAALTDLPWRTGYEQSQIEFLVSWFRFSISSDPADLANALRWYSDLGSSPDCRQYLRDLLELDSTPADALEGAVAGAHNQATSAILTAACRAAIDAWTAEEFPRCFELLRLVKSCGFDADIIDSALMTIVPTGDRQMANVLSALDSFEDAQAEESGPATASTEPLRELGLIVQDRLPAAHEWLEAVDSHTDSSDSAPATVAEKAYDRDFYREYASVLDRMSRVLAAPGEAAVFLDSVRPVRNDRSREPSGHVRDADRASLIADRPLPRPEMTPSLDTGSAADADLFRYLRDPFPRLRKPAAAPQSTDTPPPADLNDQPAASEASDPLPDESRLLQARNTRPAASAHETARTADPHDETSSADATDAARTAEAPSSPEAHLEEEAAAVSGSDPEAPIPGARAETSTGEAVEQMRRRRAEWDHDDHTLGILPDYDADPFSFAVREPASAPLVTGPAAEPPSRSAPQHAPRIEEAAAAPPLPQAAPSVTGVEESQAPAVTASGAVPAGIRGMAELRDLLNRHVRTVLSRNEPDPAEAAGNDSGTMHEAVSRPEPVRPLTLLSDPAHMQQPVVTSNPEPTPVTSAPAQTMIDRQYSDVDNVAPASDSIPHVGIAREAAESWFTEPGPVSTEPDNFEPDPWPPVVLNEHAPAPASTVRASARAPEEPKPAVKAPGSARAEAKRRLVVSLNSVGVGFATEEVGGDRYAANGRGKVPIWATVILVITLAIIGFAGNLIWGHTAPAEHGALHPITVPDDSHSDSKAAPGH